MFQFSKQDLVVKSVEFLESGEDTALLLLFCFSVLATVEEHTNRGKNLCPKNNWDKNNSSVALPSTLTS